MRARDDVQIGIIKSSHAEKILLAQIPFARIRELIRASRKSKIEYRENLARIRVVRLSSHVMQMYSMRDVDAKGRGRKRVRPLERKEFT